MRVLEHQRLKYRCPCCEGYLVRAPMPPQPIPKSLASPGLLAYIAVCKYLDALPLYRQEQMFARIGVELSRATMATWVVRLGELVQPLINLLHEQLMTLSYLHMDESTLQVLNSPGSYPTSNGVISDYLGFPSSDPVVVVRKDLEGKAVCDLSYGDAVAMRQVKNVVLSEGFTVRAA